MIKKLSDIQSCLNVFLAPENLGIDIKIIKFESIVMNLQVLAAIFDAIVDFCVTYIANIIFYDLNVFFAPKNLGIDTKIIKFELIVT